LAAGALYVSYLCILYFVQDALIYPGTRNRVDRVAPRPEGADLLHISTTEANVCRFSEPMDPWWPEILKTFPPFG
jgi:hypothetical protein